MPPGIQQSSQANIPVVLTSTAALAANPNRRYFSIQNVGTNPLFIGLGVSASATVYHQVLIGSTVAADGTGGLIQSGTVVFTGAVSVFGTSPSYVVTEM